MSRGAGFPNADVDVRLLFDPKVRRLARLLPDEQAFSAALVAYLSTLLSSWADGERLTAADAESAWVETTPERVAALQSSGLLDDEARIPEHAWWSWYGAAEERRANRRKSGQKGGKERARRDREARNAEATPEHRPGDAEAPPNPTVRPSVPTVPSVPPDGPPLPPTGGGRPSRANGTNARAVAKREHDAVAADRRGRAHRRQARQRAHLDGRLTESQRDEMDRRDAPLDEIPRERGVAYATAAAP